MGRVAAGWDVEKSLFVETGQADGVALLDEQAGKGGGETAGEIQPGRAVAGESHRGAAIDDEPGSQIGVGLEFLEIEAICAGIHPPVHEPDVVPGHIFSILGELDARPFVGALVLTGHIAGHGKAGMDLGAHEAREGFWVN